MGRMVPIKKEEKDRCLALVKENDPVYIAAWKKKQKEEQEMYDREEAAKNEEKYKRIENLGEPEGGKEGLAFFKVNGMTRETNSCDPDIHRCRSNYPELYAEHDKNPYKK